MSKYVRICLDMSFLCIFTKCLSVFLSEWGFPNDGVLIHSDIVWLTVNIVWSHLWCEHLLCLRRSNHVRHLLALDEVLIPSGPLELSFLYKWGLVICGCFAWFKEWIAMNHLLVAGIWLLARHKGSCCYLGRVMRSFSTALLLYCCWLVVQCVWVCFLGCIERLIEVTFFCWLSSLD